MNQKGKDASPVNKNRNRLGLRPSGPVLPFEVIIMAGGKGERLKPLTDAIPKPLLPVGGKPIVRYAVEQLHRAGVRNFTFVVNFQGEKIREEFGTGEQDDIQIDYIFENEPLGTIGGAKMKTHFRFDDVLIMNGDLLTTLNFEQFFLFYLEHNCDIAVGVIPYRINLPYGIFEVSEQKEILNTREKPVFSYYINTGIYFMKKEMLNLVKEGEPTDAIDLIERARQAGLRVSAFPVLDYWIDIGQMEDYQKAQKDIEFLRFDL